LECLGGLLRAILLSRRCLQANAHAIVRRQALAAGVGTAIGNHTFRSAGIIARLKNGGTLENAAAMAQAGLDAPPRSFMTGVATRSAWMRWSGSGCNGKLS
jgi:hypothetical protein